MNYTFPPGLHYSEAAISLAPYVCWILLYVFAGLLSLKPRPWPFWVASSIFVCFAVNVPTGCSTMRLRFFVSLTGRDRTYSSYVWPAS